MRSKLVDSMEIVDIQVPDIHELAAGKLAALFARNASRDLFDTCTLLHGTDMDISRLRLGFVVYGGISRKDWRTVSLEDIKADPKEIEQQLLPMLRSDLVPERGNIGIWCADLVEKTRSCLEKLLPFADGEKAFLSFLNDKGEIRPDLITEDESLAAIIRSQPGLQWKALNVRKRNAVRE